MSDSATRNRVGYDEDFSAWAEAQARLLRAGDHAALDLENLAEEIEGLSASRRKELRSRLAVLLQHLLKWKFQPEQQNRSWSTTIRVQRREIDDLLEENPSLRRTLQDVLPKAYVRGREAALDETGLYRIVETCPWTIEQVLATDFLPD